MTLSLWHKPVIATGVELRNIAGLTQTDSLDSTETIVQNSDTRKILFQWDGQTDTFIFTYSTTNNWNIGDENITALV